MGSIQRFSKSAFLIAGFIWEKMAAVANDNLSIRTRGKTSGSETVNHKVILHNLTHSYYAHTGLHVTKTPHNLQHPQFRSVTYMEDYWLVCEMNARCSKRWTLISVLLCAIACDVTYVTACSNLQHNASLPIKDAHKGRRTKTYAHDLCTRQLADYYPKHLKNSDFKRGP